MGFKLRDWHCDHCDQTQELLLNEDEHPICCNAYMVKTMMVMRRWNIDIAKQADFKRAEKKGDRVRAMEARQQDPRNDIRIKR